MTVIYTKPGDEFAATLHNAPTGIAEDLLVGVEDTYGVVVVAYSNADITEIDPGVYTAHLTAPEDAPRDCLVIWRNGPTSTSDDLYVSPIPPGPLDPSSVTTTVQAVANMLHARTKDSLGNEVGTFTDDTRPTEAQVEGLIADAAGDLVSELGGEPCNDRLAAKGRAVVAFKAAMLVELSYFPEQVQSGQSPYDKIKDLYDNGLKEVVKGVAEECGGQGSGDDGVGNLPQYDFDQIVDPIGKDTVL